MHVGPCIVAVQTMCIAFILSPLLSAHCIVVVHSSAGLLHVSDQVCLVVICSPSAENKRRSKHAGKSLNPEWNQTVIYKNILLEQVCGRTYTHVQSHTPLDVVKGLYLLEPTPQTLCHITSKKFDSVI